MHRIAQPHHLARRRAPPRAAAAAAASPTLSAPMRLISVMRPGSLAGFSMLQDAQQIVRLLRRADLHAERVLHAAQELDMRAVQLTRAVADPQEMRRAAVPVAGGGIDPGQRLLVGQQQRLVADVEVGLAHVARGGAGHAAGRHERQRLVDAVRQVLVARGQRRARGEIQVPAMHLVQVGIAAARRTRAAGSACWPTGSSRTPSAPDRACAPSAVNSGPLMMSPR